MRPAEDIKRLIKNLNDKTSAKMDERVLKDVFIALEESKKAPALTQPKIRSKIMKNPITKLAAAAVIIVITFVTVSYFCGPVDIDIATPAFAEIVKEISKARTVVYKKTFHPGESREFTTTEMINKLGIKRTEMSNGTIHIYDYSSGKTLHLTPRDKKATLTKRVGRQRRKKLHDNIGWLSMFLDTIKFAEEKEGCTVDVQGNYVVDEGIWHIGKKEINGKIADVFVFKKPFEQTTVWIDLDTNLPVRVEEATYKNPDKNIKLPQMSLSIKDFGGKEDTVRSIILSGEGGVQPEMRTVMSDFVWNKYLDKSLFSLKPPKGYTAEKRKFDVSEMGENGLVEALKFWTEMSGGTFPSKINDLGDPNMVRPMLCAKFDKNGDPSKELDRAMKQLHIVLKGLRFAQKQKVRGSWSYTGKGVRLGDSDAPVARWKSNGSYRVLYGDLRLGN